MRCSGLIAAREEEVRKREESCALLGRRGRSGDVGGCMGYGGGGVGDREDGIVEIDDAAKNGKLLSGWNSGIGGAMEAAISYD